jgi:asparagine synthase (glutamine-hydrolysing)
MCGIWLYLLKTTNTSEIELYDAFKKIQYRGPNKSTYIEINEPNKCKIGFHRLSIMDITSNGDQPFIYQDNSRLIYLICNGEIYNFKELKQMHNLNVHSNSDCEVILSLYVKFNYDINMVLTNIIGEFAFMLIDINTKNNTMDLYMTRDQLGIRPLFYSEDENGLCISSEMKSIYPITKNKIYTFPSGNYIKMTINNDNNNAPIFNKANILSYHTYNNIQYNLNQSIVDIRKNIVEILTTSVICRLQSDRPYGCLLSGGLDSSLISAIASKYLKQFNKKLKTFSIGMKDATDLKYAKMVSEYIDSEHTEIIITEEEALNIIPDVIYATESYDITTIRASVPQYLLAKYIKKNTDICVILNGDVSDELCGSYLYFKNITNTIDFEEECLKLLNELYLYDVLRVDRTLSHHGLEARVPFSDIRFIEYMLSVDPLYRIPRPSEYLGINDKKVEKALLRESFLESNILPLEVLLRTKEAFSDGCSSQENSWFIIIQNYVNKLISDEEFINNTFVFNRPPSKEAYYYRVIFEKYYKNNEHIIPHYWLPNSKYCGDIIEPSARILDIYNN